MLNSKLLLVVALATAALLVTGAAEARITRVEIQRTEPAFAGRVFGTTGAYERLIGKAYGEVDPQLPANAIIQDISLAPRNAKGIVEYVTDVDILRPADRSKGNGILFFNIHNRGNKGGIGLFNADVPTNLAEINNLADAGDGFMQRQGYTMIWFGWQADVLPGNNRLTMVVPVARNPDRSSVTGLVRSELTTLAPTTTLNLSSGWFTALATAAYPTVSTDNRTPLADGFLPTLTVRAKEQEPRVSIPNTEWSFGACPQGGNAAATDTQICYPAGFKPGRLYEIIYRAKDPLVLGLGFAAARDIGAFFKAATADDNGRENPVYVKDAKSIVMGSSQSGRFVRTLIHLGFNRDEHGQIVFDGAFPHIGGGLMPLNVRFGQPGRAAGTEQVDRLYPGASFPFSYGTETDPLTGTRAGILDNCSATSTCPKIVHAATTSLSPPMCAAISCPRRSIQRRHCRLPPRSRLAHANSNPTRTPIPGRCARFCRIWLRGSRTASNRHPARGRQLPPGPSLRPIKFIFRKYQRTDMAVFRDQEHISSALPIRCIRRITARTFIQSGRQA